MKRPCQALTKKGTPCQGGAKRGYDFCGPHLEKVAKNARRRKEFGEAAGKLKEMEREFDRKVAKG